MKVANFTKKIIGLSMLVAGSIYTHSLQAQISTATVTVYDSSSISLPSVAITSASPDTYCTGSSTTLSVTGGRLGGGTTAASWVWYEDACPTGATAPVGTGASITVSPVNTTTATITKTYYVRAEGGFCDITTACVPVSFDIYPTPIVTAPTDVVYCAGATTSAITLSGTPTGITYSIAGGADVGLADATGLTAIPSFVPINASTDPLIRTVTITPSANGCTGSPVTYTITVNPTATVVAVTNTIACAGTDLAATVFTSTTTGGTVTYTWTNDNTSIGLAASGTGNLPAFTATNTTCADITATITVTPTIDGAGTSCEGTPITFTITIHPTPNATIAAIAPELCEGSLVQLTYDATCGTGPFNVEIQQDGVSPFSVYTGITDLGTITITPTPLSPETHTYILMKITDANGCSNPVTP